MARNRFLSRRVWADSHNWSPMSYNPGTGLVYIPATVSGSNNFAGGREVRVQTRGSRTWGWYLFPGRTGRSFRKSAYRLRPPRGPKPPEGQRGALRVASDPRDANATLDRAGRREHRRRHRNDIGQSRVSGDPGWPLVAYSADKGTKLLDIQTGLRGGMGPPVTYELDGKQYISVAGGTGTVRGTPPGRHACPSRRPRHLRLRNPADGLHVQAPAATEPAATTAGAGPGRTHSAAEAIDICAGRQRAAARSGRRQVRPPLRLWIEPQVVDKEGLAGTAATRVWRALTSRSNSPTQASPRSTVNGTAQRWVSSNR